MLYMIVFINESFAGVNAVRMSNQFDTARVVFDLEERSRYTVSKLENPARIVVDFSHKISGNLADFPIKKNCFVRKGYQFSRCRRVSEPCKRKL